MKEALLFYNGEPVMVSAEEVRDDKYPKDSEFVDVEYPDYKVRFVCAGKPAQGKEIGIPYFRLYYSYEEYKKLYPDRADRYEFVIKLRRFQETQWHREWKNRLSSFCETEKFFKYENRRKFTDAYYSEYNTCIEFQHSYASFEFEDRNKFYTALNKKIIWLFHLPNAHVKETLDGKVEILEDNSRGFFRAAYEADNKFDNVDVYVQTRSKKIYKVTELFRRKGTMGEHLATLRYFHYEGRWTEDEWVNSLYTGKLLELNKKLNQDVDTKNSLNCPQTIVLLENTVKPQIQKQEEFEKISIVEEEQRLAEEAELRKIEEERKRIQKDEEFKPNVASCLEQHKTPVKKITSKRLIKCEFCGKIADESEFLIYGGLGHINLGTCRECFKNNPAAKNRSIPKPITIRKNTYNPQICPECGGLLRERIGRNGKFIGCSNYPQCRYTR